MDIESKIAVLDAEVSPVKAELAVIRPNHATKDDLAFVKDDFTTVKVDLSAVKLDVAVIRATYATKEDLLKAINTLTWKMWLRDTSCGRRFLYSEERRLKHSRHKNGAPVGPIFILLTLRGAGAGRGSRHGYSANP